MPFKTMGFSAAYKAVPFQTPAYATSSKTLSSKALARCSSLCLREPGSQRLQSKDEGDGAQPAAKVIEVSDMNLITIDSKDAEKYPLATAEKIEAPSELNATGRFYRILRAKFLSFRWRMVA